MKKWQWEIDQNTFDVINIDFFVNYKPFTLLSYLSIFIFLILKILFISSDIYTLVRLIIFNTWSSDVHPFISYAICRWLFLACILLSIVLYIYGFIRSILVYRTRNVSLTYIDSGASFMYSVKSYKYYCVYNQISSDNFFNYLTFFTYFNLHNCLILLLGDTPRQIINGITIFKILKFNSSMIDVIRHIATTDYQEAIVLSFMTFSFIIWFIFMVKFLMACILFFPLRYQITTKHGYQHGMKQYCCIKINECVQKIMRVKHAKSLEQVKRDNANIYPTMPNINFYDEEKHDYSDTDSDSMEYKRQFNQSTISLLTGFPERLVMKNDWTQRSLSMIRDQLDTQSIVDNTLEPVLDEERLIHNDTFANKKTLIEDLELPRRR